MASRLPRPPSTSPSPPIIPLTTTKPRRSPRRTGSACWSWWRATARLYPPRNGPPGSATSRTGWGGPRVGDRPAVLGNKQGRLAEPADWESRGAFLRREELPDGVTLSLVAVGTASAGGRQLYVAGGQQLDREFLSSLVLPEGMRVLLYRNLEPGFS